MEIVAKQKIKLVIGFITYGELTAKYLPYFLSSLKNQTFKDFKIIAIDNSDLGKDENIKYIQTNYPEIELSFTGQNMGYAKTYNIMLNRAEKMGADYFLTINPDMILEADSISKLIEEVEKDQNLASVCPKILKWDFANNQKTKIIDSCGIVKKPGLLFFDLGQSQVDKNQYDKASILGPSGAAGLYRMSALNNIKEGDQIFEERFFMYKEDCDLALRLWLKGYKSKMIANSIVFHDRTAAGLGENMTARITSRRSKSHQIRIWSFINQQIIYYKFWGILNFQEKMILVKNQCLLLIYIVVFEPYLLLRLPELAIVRRGAFFYK